MTNYTNKCFSGKEKSDELSKLDDGELGEQKCTQKIGILPRPMNKWQIKRIDELDKLYCTSRGRMALRYWLYKVHWLICCNENTVLWLIIRTIKHDARNIS